MKAVISELWDTGMKILVNENEEGFSCFADLAKCKNVLLGKKLPCRNREVLLDDSIITVNFRNVSHPSGCGKLKICEF